MKKLMLLSLMACALVLVGCSSNTTTPTADNSQPTQGTVENGETNNAGVDLDQTTALAQCLTENGVIMYGTEWCGHCQNQKALFGDAFAEVSYIDCDAQRQTCLDAGVRGFPTWIDTAGNQYPGTQQLARLAEIGGCAM